MLDRHFKEAVRDALLDNAEGLFEFALGEPTRRASSDWRPKGRNGLSVKMRGTDRGKWFDHTADIGGDVIDLYAVEVMGLSKPYGSAFPSILKAAGDWAGITQGGPQDLEGMRRRSAERQRKALEDEKATAAARQALVTRLQSVARPVTGSPAEAYLKSRGITQLPSAGLSYIPPLEGSAGLLSPQYAALGVWGLDASGQVIGGQRVLIEQSGQKPQLGKDAARKPSFGAVGVAVFKGSTDGPLCVCEGPESALSVWQATGLETWAVFGVSGWATAPLPLDRKVILCPDRDAPVGTFPANSDDAKRKEAAARAFAKAVAAHMGAGVDVWIAQAPEDECSKKDLNDTLQRAGNEAVRAVIGAAYKAEFKPLDDGPPPVHPAPTGDRKKALQATGDVIRDWAKASAQAAWARRDVARGYEELDTFLNATGEVTKAERTAAQNQIRQTAKERFSLDYLPSQSWPKGYAGMRAAVSGAQGAGKTAAMVGGERGGKAFKGALHDGWGLVTVFLSPTHGKSQEAMRDYLEAFDGLRHPVPVQALGRDAEHPDDPQRTACELSEQTAKAAKQGVNIRKAFCSVCPFAETCAYLARIRDIEAACASPQGAVIFGVHEHAFVNMAGVESADRYIFDERPRDFGHVTHSIRTDDWGRDLRDYLDWTGQSASVTADALGDLLSLIQPVRTAIGRALMETPETSLQDIAEAMAPHMGEGDTAGAVVRKVAGRLQQFNSDRLADRIKGEIEAHTFAAHSAKGRPKSLESRLDDSLDAADESHVRNLIEILQAVAKELDQGHGPALSAVQVQKTKSVTVIRADVIESAQIPEHAPLLYLDGTADADAAQAWFGPLQRHHLPVERLTEAAFLVKGHSFSTSSVTGVNPKTGQPLNADKAAVVRDKLKAVIARNSGAFVAAPKAVLEALGDLPNNVTMYFGNLRGRNDAKDCETAILIGRNLPPVVEVERKARAFAVALDRPFAPIEPTECPTRGKVSEWPRRSEGVRMAGGKSHGVDVEYHPDPTAQMIVRQIRDAEAIQAIDRVRAQYNVRRFIILSASIPDLTFTQVVKWQDMAAGGTRLQRAVQGLGVVPLSPAEAQRVLPAIWKDRNAVRRDVEYQQLRKECSQNVLGGQKVLNKYLIPNDHPKECACLVAYKRPVQGSGRGRAMPRHLAIVVGHPSEYRQTLEAVVGRVAECEILDWNAAAHAADVADPKVTTRDTDAPAEVSVIKETPSVAPFPAKTPARMDYDPPKKKATGPPL